MNGTRADVDEHASNQVSEIRLTRREEEGEVLSSRHRNTKVRPRFHPAARSGDSHFSRV